MALQLGASPDEKTKVLDSTSEISPEKDRANKIANGLMLQIQAHPTTKTYILAVFRGENTDQLFKSDKSKEKVLRNVKAIGSQINKKAGKKGVSEEMIKQALFTALEIEDLDAQLKLDVDEGVENKTEISSDSNEAQETTERIGGFMNETRSKLTFIEEADDNVGIKWLEDYEEKKEEEEASDKWAEDQAFKRQITEHVRAGKEKQKKRDIERRRENYRKAG
jgi:hypothetical protein